ncbi:flagellar hook-associated protein FlgK [Alkalihalobacillus sp. MEB130]|uniref:flagellar hook-associated protein FlgK n=1 Tax=Alkalihalobacillus sp. MEB130 TaxID=2976704 RepID=UPI0028DF1A55|nr:flagellar hook-associated protein FlgK [Alkalihalobacillus sp. MEB130]MDT8858789.1 flagellar hook-associated protein FlgK [Alkalihalobacillus sp. MEB130]
MQSTFHGLETARRAMMTQQSALHTTGHNIANANTPGYTRQRVNFTQTEPYPSIGLNAPRLPGHLGTGVAAGSIQRVRESFLDVQYRNENNKVGYWDARYNALEKMEDILNEPSEQGLSRQIDMLWTAFQDLSVDPEDSGARSVVRQRAVAVAETFTFLHSSLTTIQSDYQNEIEVTKDEANAILRQLENINAQIRETEPHGYVTNDLYDEQDRLLDQLSRIMNIKVEREKSGGNPNPAAEGAVTVLLVNDQGQPIENMKLVDAKGLEERKEFSISYDDNQMVNGFTLRLAAEPNTPVGTIELDSMPRGELKALIEAYGFVSNDGIVKGLYPDMLNNLDQLAYVFMSELNAVHSEGYTLASGNQAARQGVLLFDLGTTGPNGEGAASQVKVHADILASLNNIAAASGTDGVFAGDGSNARTLANVKDRILTFNGDNGTVSSFYQGIIGQMAVDTSEAMRMHSSNLALRESVDYRRSSVSNVSLDEEMTMLIQFQHAYNAAARNITMVDEMLDRIINGMGVVGR